MDYHSFNGPVKIKGCVAQNSGDGSVISRHLILVCPFSLAFSKPTFSFIIALTVTVDGEPQTCNTSPSTCWVMPRVVRRAFCGAFEGTIRFDLPASG